MYTADADVISQITARRIDFPKPTWLYKSIDIYDKNIVSSEGEPRSHYRKLASPALSEKNNQLVWAKTLNQASASLKYWVGNEKGDKGPIRTLGADTRRLTLNVITYAGFGKQQHSEDQRLAGGHVMSFSGALNHILSHIYVLTVFPSWLLKVAPSTRLRKTFNAYDEWARYMHQILTAKKAELSSRHSISPSDFDVDLVRQLVKGQELDQDSTGSTSEVSPLTDSELIGNCFLFIFASHETTAVTLHLAIILLALNPSVQIKVQQQLDKILEGRPVSQWNYERDLPPLFSNVLGAVLNEVLRLYGPAISIPKWIPEGPQNFYC